MEAIAQRGHTLMQWLLVLGLLAGWSMFDRSPRVVVKARQLVSGSLSYPQQFGFQDSEEMLAELKLDHGDAAIFKQYHHEFLRHLDVIDPWPRQFEENALRPVSIGAVLKFGEKVTAQLDRTDAPPSLTGLSVDWGVRGCFAQLQTWHQKSGLSPSASLGEVEQALRSSVQIPGTDQKIPLDQCMLFVALGIAAIQTMLVSLLATLRALKPGREELDLSWVLFQRAPLGVLLTLGCLVGPPLVWFAQDFLRTAEFNELPGWNSRLLNGLLLATTFAVVRQARLVRRELLGAKPIETGKAATAVDAANAAPRTQPRKAA